jgi:TolB-like protein/Flp pilus assembly protein TadD
MKCPKCHLDNPDDSKFCKECGTNITSSDEVLPSITKTIATPIEEYPRGSTFADRYKIIEQLGTGGMGAVYRVEDTKIGQDIALKLIKPEIASDKKTIERFRNELKTTRMISHRNVCRMFDLGDAEGTHFITMEYIPGEDLKSFIRRVGQLPSGKAISIAKQVCEGLAEAHRLGVVHRDLKSNNIMIDKEGNARIMDFGIARSLEAKGITGAGVMIGTPEYMSPEQVEGKEIDQRSDIYSLGVILYEMVTGLVPFEGDTPFTIGVKHKSEMPKDPKELNSQISDDLSHVILRCLEKEKEKRFQSAGEVRSELTNIEKGMPTTERKILDKKPLTSKEITVTFRKPWLMIAVILAVVVATLAVIFFLIKEKPVTPSLKKNMLVVLPFENLGPPEDEYFADGITEELTSRLAALHGLGVISRSSAIQYKKTDKTIKQIGEELGADYVLEGTVRWDRSTEGKGRVRVTPQLIRVSDNTHLWSERYDRIIEDIFVVQSGIAEQVIKQLDLTVLEPERNALLAQPTDNIEAYDNMMRAREHWNKAYLSNDIQEFEQVIQMLEKAIQLDPNLALAYVYISHIHRILYFFGYDQTEERLSKWKAAVDNALELQPDLPEAQLALAWYYYQGFLDYDRALKILESVHKARPNHPPSLLGWIQRRQGKWEQCLANLEKAFNLNPRSSNLAYELGTTNMSMRRYEEAEFWLNRAFLIEPDDLDIQSVKYLLFYLKGETKKARDWLETLNQSKHTDINWFYLCMAERNYQEVVDRLASLSYDFYESQDFYFHKDLALASVYHVRRELSMMKTHAESARIEIERLVKERPQDPRFHAALGLVYAYLELNEDAVREGQRAVELHPISKDALSGQGYIFDLATIYTIVGEYDSAIDNLENLMSLPSGSLISVHSLQLEPTWDPLRELPRFQQLLKKYSVGE